MRTADPARVKRIIDAAVQLFADRPYHEVRMEDIAERAQVAKGTLYLHYRDREALLVGMKSTWLRSLVGRIEVRLREDMSPEEKLLTMNRESSSFFETNHFFPEVIQRLESIRLGEESECFESRGPGSRGSCSGSSASSPRAGRRPTRSGRRRSWRSRG